MEFDTLEQTKERIENWRLAYRSNKSKRVTASLEGRYRSPQHWEAPQPKNAIDLLDAHKVEAAWLGLPDRQKQILKYSVFNPFIPIFIFCRKVVKMNQKDFEIELNTSIKMLDNRLRKTLDTHLNQAYK